MGYKDHEIKQLKKPQILVVLLDERYVNWISVFLNIINKTSLRLKFRIWKSEVFAVLLFEPLCNTALCGIQI